MLDRAVCVCLFVCVARAKCVRLDRALCLAPARAVICFAGWGCVGVSLCVCVARAMCVCLDRALCVAPAGAV